MIFKRFPVWLAVAPGVIAGWLAFQLPDPAAGMIGNANPVKVSQNHHGLAKSEGYAESNAAATASRKFPLTIEKLAILRCCHRRLRLDFRSFLAESESTTRSAFEVLCQVMDLTATEEAALKQEFARCSGELVAYEKRDLRDFSVSPGRIGFQVVTGGPFHDGLTRRVADAQVRILGETRAEIFAAITGSAGFCSSGVPSATVSMSTVEILMDRTHGFMRVNATLGGKEWWMTSTPTPDPLKQSFERFDHLIDDAARLRFRELPDP